MKEENNIEANTFLRWAGSKKKLINELNFFLPENFNKYHEPFLGSGAFYFNSIKKEDSYLSDSNNKLINTYIQIRDNVEDVICQLKSYKNTKEFYYSIREKLPTSQVEEAAQFIFLNRTCYNGLYRVNKNNGFNVPYGKRKNVDFVTENLLLAISRLIKSVNFNTFDFEDTLPFIAENDLVFIDPPYVVSHNENGFIEYNQKIFTWEDQIRLKEFIRQIINKNAFYILTNAAHESIRELYIDISEPYEINRLSKIGGKNAFRGIVKEFVFSNTIRQ